MKKFCLYKIVVRGDMNDSTYDNYFLCDRHTLGLRFSSYRGRTLKVLNLCFVVEVMLEGVVLFGEVKGVR